MTLHDLLSFPSDDSLIPKGPSELREAAMLLRRSAFTPFGLATAVRLEMLAKRFEAALEDEMLLVCSKCHGTGCKRAALVIEDWSKCPRCAEERTRCKPKAPEATAPEFVPPPFPRFGMVGSRVCPSAILRKMNKSETDKNLADARDMLLAQENKEDT